MLKSGFYATPNKVIKMVPLIVDGVDSVDFFRYSWDQWYPMPANWSDGRQVKNSFVVRQDLSPLKVGGSYTLSFALRGAGIRDGQAKVAYLGANENKPTKFTAARRGMKVVKDEAHEELYETEKFSDTAQWMTVKKSIPHPLQGQDHQGARHEYPRDPRIPVRAGTILGLLRSCRRATDTR